MRLSVWPTSNLAGNHGRALQSYWQTVWSTSLTRAGASMATELDKDKEQVNPLTREQVLQYREVFTRYGKENGGKISPKDLGISNAIYK